MIDMHAPPARKAHEKVKALEELQAIAEDARNAGLKVVLCHGVFDLVHMGHVRHLEKARQEGDMLIVTTTADQHVNKGPGRPIFPEQLRAEMIGALEYVDWVGINPAANADYLLRTIRPNVYVKGSDYENPEDDVTGNIDKEKNAVEEHGGKIVFTKDITFSSSALINEYLDVYDPSLRDYLIGFKNSYGLNAITNLVDKVKDFRVLVVGDTIIDEYQYVSPLGKSPKENMISTLFDDKEIFAGGVIAAANHVADFCKHVEVITCLGDTNSHEDLVRKSLKQNVQLHPFYRKDAPTTCKTRFVEISYLRKLFEVYSMDDSPLDGAVTEDMNDLIQKIAGDFDLVIVTDFGHGMIGPQTIKVLTKHSKFLAVNAQSNSANTGFNLITRYPSADFICIDAPEAQMAVADKFCDIAVIAEKVIPNLIDCSKIILTHGKHGCVTYEDGKGSHRIPAFTKTVIDTVGAGDAFFAVTAPLVAAQGQLDHIGLVGNAAGAMKVGIVGHRNSVEKIPLMRYIATLLK